MEWDLIVICYRACVADRAPLRGARFFSPSFIRGLKPAANEHMPLRGIATLPNEQMFIINSFKKTLAILIDLRGIGHPPGREIPPSLFVPWAEAHG
jgi:hypothetical protein